MNIEMDEHGIKITGINHGPFRLVADSNAAEDQTGKMSKAGLIQTLGQPANHITEMHESLARFERAARADWEAKIVCRDEDTEAVERNYQALLRIDSLLKDVPPIDQLFITIECLKTAMRQYQTKGPLGPAKGTQ